MEKTAITIINTLKNKGYEAYFAGGCVRDMLLGVEPKDYDIVTSAKPEDIEDILEHTIPIGKQFGVILALRNGHHFEVATFRSDSGYSDGRRPDYVTFTSAKEDAIRRDFTVNGMFFDPIANKVIDYVEGKNDLNEKVIRFIGDPKKRIKEDHLRIIRAIRFKTQLKFQYEPRTYQTIKKYKKLILDISKERIRDELIKIMQLPNLDEAFTDLEDLRILDLILPEILNLKGVAQPLKYHQEGDVWNHTFKALKSLSLNTPNEVKWAVLFHDSGKPDTFIVKQDRIHFDGHCQRSAEIAYNALLRLKFPKEFISNVVWLIKHHMMMKPLLEMTQRRQNHWYSHPQFSNLLQVFKADITGSDPSDFTLYNKIYADFVNNKITPTQKLLTGKDLIKYFGINPGPIIGKILKEVEHQHLEENIHTREEALIYTKTLIKKWNI